MNKLTCHNGHWGVGQHLNLQYFNLLKTIQKFLQAVHCMVEVGKGKGRENLHLGKAKRKREESTNKPNEVKIITYCFMGTYYMQDRAWLPKHMQMKKSDVPEVRTGKEDG